MASLRIEAKYKKNGELGEAVAEVPFETGRHELPKVYPFTKNQYLGPDAGYSLGWIHVDAEEKRLTFGFGEIVNLDENGRGHWREENRIGDFVEFDFSLI
ncbi:MAG: hypothetical protein J5736_05795 [Bacilli bacterium]|nr:hypothetical protein [Bacilli bacterium]